ncbi:PREDICTED: receptor-type tyrosine-protein phosphatase alpha-like [Amphimedon queenslandica]|uniref:Tyrosine specific protein phosphatases domain-containing protein n=1 Tax=Amphimedon queenslandica TaxID=400682 RepID=A0A1X7TSR6_AMPQE|nr:PREDICTED: receptor-type tyrosine-protein phosphatase alpha-like [Amphimedon queenslandica]|eukprot:XP_019857979.1 PREDICTED: receptor-type tyrosine-protein phosphatase alpha-like [Amphimedon queenslandica]
MVVHCSSGTGRTGTFIAIMVEMARIKSEKLVDIFNNVQYMRKCRPMMVMNENEYMFIHDALAEALKLGKIEGVAFAGPKSLEETSSERKSEGSFDKKNPADEETKL